MAYTLIWSDDAQENIRIQPYHTLFYAVVETQKEIFVLNVIDQRMDL